jgi:general secretion pathway protein A
MLTRYFGLQENPFGVTPDPRFLYSSRTHREALASLHYAFYSNRGFTALIAPPGMGKTTLLFDFLDHIRNTARTAFLFNSQCEPTDLIREILHDVGSTAGYTLADMLHQLNAELLETARSGRQFVVVVDEAQNLSEQALETLRLLTNFETSRAKLMQIVLSGQPQLADKLSSPDLVQLRQRISTFCRLEPFTSEETAAYISHRLKVAGYDGSVLFTAESLARIAEVSQGIPRNINTLCFNALSLCCALRRKKVDPRILEEAIHDLQLTERVPGQEDGSEMFSAGARDRFSQREAGFKRRRWWIPASAVGFALAMVATFWALQFRNNQAKHPAGPVHAPSGETAPSAAAGSNVSAPPRPARDPNAIEITVDPEQTLSDISVQTLGSFDSTVLQHIQELNPDLANPDLIHPGEKILLPGHARPTGKSDHPTPPTTRKTP